MRAMTLVAMLFVGDRLPSCATAQVRCDTCALVQDLDRGQRGADLHQLMHQVLRGAVKVGIECHVIIDVDAGADQSLRSNGSVGHGFKAGLSMASNTVARLPSRLRNGRSFSLASNSRMARLSSSSEKNLRWRSAPQSSVASLALRFPLSLCPLACTVVRARFRSRNALRSCSKSDQVWIVTVRLGTPVFVLSGTTSAGMPPKFSNVRTCIRSHDSIC